MNNVSATKPAFAEVVPRNPGRQQAADNAQTNIIEYKYKCKYKYKYICKYKYKYNYKYKYTDPERAWHFFSHYLYLICF